MPEIPDMEVIHGFLSGRLRDRDMESVETSVPWLIRSTEGLDSLVGHAFTGVRRRGKFLVFDTDDERVLVVNPMLSGRFTWAEAGERERTGNYVTISFTGRPRLCYTGARRMGRWYLIGAEDLDSVPGFPELGPDALEVGEQTFVEALARRRGQLKNTLTNQRFVAGIGNAYADEILWEAGLHPHRRGSTLDEADRRWLYKAMRATFEWALPIVEQQVRDGLHQRDDEWREHMRVHRREGDPCPRCESPIRAQVRSGRETDYCLKC